MLHQWAECIAGILKELDGAMGEINKITASVESNMPGISILISQTQTLIKQMQDVMEGLKNNPLLKNGISEKPEKENATPKLSEDKNKKKKISVRNHFT